MDLPSTLKVEVYPIEIFLCLHSNMDNVISKQFSRADTICELITAEFSLCNQDFVQSFVRFSKEAKGLEFPCSVCVCVFRFHPEGHVRCI